MIYLDHHATTPVDPAVLDAMLPYFTEKFGNAASRQYRLGWDAQSAVDDARAAIAALIGADAKEIVFTSGATEANNLALKGLVDAARRDGDHVVTVATEHKSVLDTCRSLERRGCETTILGVRERRADRSRSAARRGDRTDGGRERDGGEQRDRRARADGGDRRDRAREGCACSTPTRCRRLAKCRST